MEPIEFSGDRLIYIDIETDPACSRIWLIGLLVDGWFTQFYVDSWGEERLILERFLRFLETHRGYTLVSYSGTGFDYRITLNAIRRHELDASPLEECQHVDLCTLLRRSFIFPHHSHALKELGAYLGYRFTHSELDGLRVALSYQRHVGYGVPLEAGVPPTQRIYFHRNTPTIISRLLDREAHLPCAGFQPFGLDHLQ